jgi:hypothetical protein
MDSKKHAIIETGRKHNFCMKKVISMKAITLDPKIESGKDLPK